MQNKERTSHKINLDKYYTPVELATRLTKLTLEKINAKPSEIMEPAAGAGSFLHSIKETRVPYLAYDIEPGDEGTNKIIKADFLQLNIPYKQGRLCIGNPPFGCFVEDTEVYTKRGWLKFNELNYDDMCLSVDIVTKQMEWSNINNIIKKKINEGVYHYYSSNLDLTVTKDHRMFAYDKFTHLPKLDGDDVFIAENLPYSRSCIHKFGYKWEGVKEDYFILPEEILHYKKHDKIIPEQKINMKDWAKFFGLWIADGCCRHTKNTQGNQRYTVSIKQHKKTVDIVLKICDKLPFKYRIYENKNQNSFNIDINSKQLWNYLCQFGKSKDKWIPEYIKDGSKEIIKSFMDGYTFGDSRQNKKYITSKGCNTISKRLIEDLQICILKLGYLTNYSVFDEKYQNKPYTRYSIQYHLSKKDRDNTIYYKKPILEQYKGFVYCVTLNKNGFFLIRRNNKICFSGNCSNNLSIKFYKKCCEIGDYVAFIQPISQLNNNSQLYEFDLIYSEDLRTISYSGRKLHCCFNIYKRPANGKLNKFKSTKDIMKNHPVLKHLTIKEYRRGSTSVDKIQEGWCVAFCSWGGHFGKVPKFIGEYPQETYIYVSEETEGEMKEKIKELFSYDNLRGIKFIAMRRISLARICNYIMDNWKE